ncbi:MAG: hypothetical protein R2810_06505 [Flavobacteriales bacterium]
MVANGGFADLSHRVRQDGDGTEDKNLSAFIVEKGLRGGITLNPEEKKMGIEGGSAPAGVLQRLSDVERRTS